MRPTSPLPPQLGRSFHVRQALDAGVSQGRLRGRDLAAPFTGIRTQPTTTDRSRLDPFTRQVFERREQALNYGPRLRAEQFLSHESAVAIWGGPLPLVFPAHALDIDPAAAHRPLDGRDLDVHVSTPGSGPLVRAAGVKGHRADIRSAKGAYVRDFRVASPAVSWAQLGELRLLDLVALGDYYCRVWREGVGRPDAGKKPLATINELRSTLEAHRWAGMKRLRQAVELVREDAWSPRESQVRCHLVLGGLPEPSLNYEVYDEQGRFIGCVDLAYPEHKIAIEYHGMLHRDQYADDVERIASLRAAGWIVIEVTSTLFAEPARLISRVRAALNS